MFQLRKVKRVYKTYNNKSCVPKICYQLSKRSNYGSSNYGGSTAHMYFSAKSKLLKVQRNFINPIMSNFKNHHNRKQHYKTPIDNLENPKKLSTNVYRSLQHNINCKCTIIGYGSSTVRRFHVRVLTFSFPGACILPPPQIPNRGLL